MFLIYKVQSNAAQNGAFDIHCRKEMSEHARSFRRLPCRVTVSEIGSKQSLSKWNQVGGERTPSYVRELRRIRRFGVVNGKSTLAPGWHRFAPINQGGGCMRAALAGVYSAAGTFLDMIAWISACTKFGSHCLPAPLTSSCCACWAGIPSPYVIFEVML